MDGWITIGTKLDTDEFDKQIVELEKKQQKDEEKLELKLKAKLQAQKEIEEHRQKIFEVEQEYEKLSQKVEQAQAIMEKQGKGISLTPQDFTDLQNYNEINLQYEKVGSQLDKMYAKQDQLNMKVQKTSMAYQDVNDKVTQYKQKIDSIRLQRQQSEVNKLKEGFKGIGSSIQNAVHKAGKLVLGIFAIRSAFMLLRRASSDLASYDSQYAANIEYIRYALTQAIAPVLRAIVQLAMQALQFINMIVNALFGVNLFSQASAENFNKMKTSASGVSKAVKEIKKQLLGFDEINMLTDQSDTGTSPGAAGVGTPDIDLSKIEGEPPEWLKWILDNKDLILSILGGIAAALVAIKLGVSGIKALGIGLLIGGIIYGIQNLFKYLEDPSWENFGKIIQGIGVAILGLGIVTGNVPLIIAGAITAIIGILVQYWEQIKTFFQNGIDWLRGKSEEVHTMFGDVIGAIYDAIVGVLQIVLNWFDNTFKSLKKTFDGLIEFIKGIFTADWDKAWHGIQDIFGGVWDFITGTFSAFYQWLYTILIKPVFDIFVWLFNSIDYLFKSIWNGIITALAGFGSWLYNTVIQPVFNFFNGLWTGIINGFSAAWEGIKTIFSTVTEFFRTIFTNAWTAVKNVFMTGGKIFDGIKEGIVNAFKAIVNAIILGINKVVAIPFNAINGVLSAIKNVNIFGITPFDWIHTIYVPQIPYLKTGGIVNMPNRGTMVGGAMAGESGREGVVPLTDQQAMAELGREIGKNVLVNLTNITSMNGRVISRELKTIQSEQNFAYNI